MAETEPMRDFTFAALLFALMIAMVFVLGVGST